MPERKKKPQRLVVTGKSAALKKIAKVLEAWQDADRTMTSVELSKEGPGWQDNQTERREAAIREALQMSWNPNSEAKFCARFLEMPTEVGRLLLH